MKIRSMGVLFACLGILAVSHQVAALEKTRTGVVTKIYSTSDGDFGGCAVDINQFFGSGCGLTASFDCSSAADKGAAFGMFDMAQMAYALGKPVKVTVDSALLTADGKCKATYVELVP